MVVLVPPVADQLSNVSIVFLFNVLYEKNPDLIQQKIKTLKKQNKIKCPLVYIDEFQLAPQIMNEIQVLIDKK